MSPASSGAPGATATLRRYPTWRLTHAGPYDSLVGVLLANRRLGGDDVSDSPEILHDPELMRDLPRAAQRLEEAVRGGERIVVFGDYDVDGVTSTALVTDFLGRTGADVRPLLPHRMRDGYGLKAGAVERILAEEPDLVVTADNGVGAHEAIAVLGRAGADVVVIDHHHPPERLPDAVAVIDPNRADCPYPFKGLAAVGVAFKLLQALSAAFLDGDERRRYLNDLLDLVALGTVADVAPMVGENRLLTRRGLAILATTARPGLAALKAVAGVDGSQLDETAVSFFLGPRLNSAGRLADAGLAYSLLATTSHGEAGRLAAELDELNARRRQLQELGSEEALEQVVDGGMADQPILVVRGESWHLGVVGLIASRLAEAHHRPAAACTAVRGDGTLTGSARSVGGYHLAEGIGRCAELLTDCGGHSEAAGFSLEADRFEAFRERLVADGRERIAAEDLVPRLDLDCALEPRHLDLEVAHQVAALAPFGAGNPAPRFLIPGCQVIRVRTVGQEGAHLKLRLRRDDRFVDALWWRRGEAASLLSPGDRVDVASTLESNTWNGRTHLQLVVEDLRPAG